VAVDIFMNFPQPANSLNGPITIKGEVQDQTHLNWVGVQSVAFGIENPITIGSTTTGAGTGKAKFNQLQITKAVDSASPLLFSAVGLGAHFPTVTLAMRKSGGTTAPADFLIYTFAMVFVQEVDWSADAGGDNPTETVTLVFGAMSVSYAKQTSTGTLSTPAVSNWSVVLNQPTLNVS
jgi:type VI secretion system secreted protein Hcp